LRWIIATLKTEVKTKKQQKEEVKNTVIKLPKPVNAIVERKPSQRRDPTVIDRSRKNVKPRADCGIELKPFCIEDIAFDTLQSVDEKGEQCTNALDIGGNVFKPKNDPSHEQTIQLLEFITSEKLEPGCDICIGRISEKIKRIKQDALNEAIQMAKEWNAWKPVPQFGRRLLTVFDDFPGFVTICALACLLLWVLFCVIHCQPAELHPRLSRLSNASLSSLGHTEP